MEELKKVLDKMLEEKLDKLREQMVKEISCELQKVQEQVRELDQRMLELENYSRRNNVVFYGVPESEEEDSLVLAEKLGEALEVSLKPHEVDVAHRLRSRSGKHPQPLIVRIRCRWKKQKIMQAAKVKKPTADLLGGDKKVRIYANEHLAPRTQELLTYARKLKENYFVWSSNGQVLCRRRAEKAQPIPIRVKDDVDFVEESQEGNIEGAFFQRAAKRERESMSAEGSPSSAQLLRPLKKALRHMSQPSSTQASNRK